MTAFIDTSLSVFSTLLYLFLSLSLFLSSLFLSLSPSPTNVFSEWLSSLLIFITIPRFLSYFSRRLSLYYSSIPHLSLSSFLCSLLTSFLFLLSNVLSLHPFYFLFFFLLPLFLLSIPLFLLSITLFLLSITLFLLSFPFFSPSLSPLLCPSSWCYNGYQCKSNNEK